MLLALYQARVSILITSSMVLCWKRGIDPIGRVTRVDAVLRAPHMSHDAIAQFCKHLKKEQRLFDYFLFDHPQSYPSFSAFNLCSQCFQFQSVLLFNPNYE